MAMTKQDGTPLSIEEGDSLRAQIAYEILRELAHTWGAVTTYGGLAAEIEGRSGITDTQRRQWWISRVLDAAAVLAVEHGEPPLTALCVGATGSVGDGYLAAVKMATASRATDPEVAAAEDRLLCYRFFADLGSAPVRQRPTLPPTLQSARRPSSWLDDLVSVGHLTVGDEVPFPKHVDVARLFGRTYKGHQRATIPLDASTVIWFPKMYPNADWTNVLEDQGTVIRMTPQPGGSYSMGDKDPSSRQRVVTFGHVRDWGSPFYKFMGVFEVDQEASTDEEWVHRRLSDTVYFDGNGQYAFDTAVGSGRQDDQLAETSPADPGLVDDYTAEIEAAKYEVADHMTMSKVRGSAQRAFANRVKSNYGGACAVTGITSREFLVASHIVPWSDDPKIRLDPTNGICLSTFVDRAFDARYIWIDDALMVRVRWDRVVDDPILRVELRKLDGVALTPPSRESPDPAKLRRRLDLGY